MISVFRRSLETWPVRIFFMIMVAAFVLWGIGDVVRSLGTSTWVAKIGGTTIEMGEFQRAFQADLGRLSQRLPQGQDMTPAMRRAAGDQTLARMVAQASLAAEVERLHIAVPDAVLRQAVFAMPTFKNPAGVFDRQRFLQVLSQNGMTEAGFLGLARADMAQRQLLGAVSAGIAAPATLTNLVFDFEREQRSADTLTFAFSAVPAPPAPDAAVLKRWYENHPRAYSAPEYRKIEAVLLSPDSIAKGLSVSDAELRQTYERYKSDYIRPEKRSAEVISASSQAVAAALAKTWQGGADWAAMQKAAAAQHAVAVALDNATKPEFPDPALADAIFAAKGPGIVGPIKGALGWHVIDVTAITPGQDRSFDQVKASLRTRALADKATNLMYDRANKIDNILGSGASLEELPNDLGLEAVKGTLDEKGDTPAGVPAPIPGPPALRAALIAAAFKTAPGAPPQLTEVPMGQGSSAYYALVVQSITRPAMRPYADVAAQVLKDWTANAVQHTQNVAATAAMLAIRKGTPIEAVAKTVGLSVGRTPLVARGDTDSGVDPHELSVLFGLKPHQPAMVETQDGFVVLVPDEIRTPDPKNDPIGYGAIQQALSQQIGGDVETAFADALRERAHVRVNQTNFNSIIQP